MKIFMILLSVGKDRPGIVEDVSTFLFERGANLEDSRMAVMGGCFSIMTLFSCMQEQCDRIKTDLGQLHRLGLETSIHEAEDPSENPKGSVIPLKMGITAMDHPGIVQKVVHLLRQYDVNIQSLNTHITRAPLSGTPLFNLKMEADVPAEKSIAKIKEKLMNLAMEMNLDINFLK